MCKLCKGKGYIKSLSIGHPKGDKLRIEKCDECNKFATDKQAKAVYKLLASKKEHFNKWFNKFLRSDNVMKSDGKYITQCSLYSIRMNKTQLKAYYKKEYYNQQF